MKVYVIRYEDLWGDKYSSGVSYVFDTLEKAEIMLEEIKKDEIEIQIVELKNKIKELKRIIAEDMIPKKKRGK